MRGADVLPVLRLLCAAYPTYPVDADTITAYERGLGQLRNLDLDTLVAAADRWVTEEDRYPTLHQLIGAYQAEARRRLDVRRLADERRALAAGTLPGVGPVDVPYGAEMIDVLNSALALVRGDTARTPDERAELVEATVADLLARRGIRPAPEPVITYRCAHCRDMGLVESPRDSDRWRPCPACNDEGHQRWLAGHLMPGHRCAECDGVVRGKR